MAAGLAALKAAGDDAAPLAGIAEQLTRLYAQKDAAVEAVLVGRLAPLEARLAELEGRPWDPDAEEARAQAQAIAAQLIAVRAAAEQTGLFADRLALLEASLPRLSAAQARLMQALERQARRPPAAPPSSRGRRRRRGRARRRRGDERGPGWPRHRSVPPPSRAGGRATPLAEPTSGGWPGERRRGDLDDDLAACRGRPRGTRPAEPVTPA